MLMPGWLMFCMRLPLTPARREAESGTLKLPCQFHYGERPVDRYMKMFFFGALKKGGFACLDSAVQAPSEISG